MNTETSAAHKRSGAGAAPRPGRYAGAQLSLPLELDSGDEDALRAAWKRCGLRMPYHLALRNRPLAICLSCLADAMRRSGAMDCYAAGGESGSKRGRKKQHS